MHATGVQRVLYMQYCQPYTHIEVQVKNSFSEVVAVKQHRLSVNTFVGCEKTHSLVVLVTGTSNSCCLAVSAVHGNPYLW